MSQTTNDATLMSQQYVDAELRKMLRNVPPIGDDEAMALRTISE